ncbi:MAG: D-glycero-beta-D-manno-heptose 1-phosphate adenylyltransferase [Candidatus Margulisbacteria bacterium]|nr:D-glycero-beta-D-manno-heptose 1-phosphate adenylyltransferase [Candidatus Margulisiibacteriota bacterium]
MHRKYFTLETAAQWIGEQQVSSKRVVFTNGCFDLLHRGHLAYLEEAKALGDVLIIGVNSDASVRRLKGAKRPIMPQEDRLTLLASLEMVDAVVLFDDETPIPLLRVLRPDIHVKGGDYAPESLPEYSVVIGYGGQVKILSFVEGCSSSGIITRIVERYGHDH